MSRRWIREPHYGQSGQLKRAPKLCHRYIHVWRNLKPPLVPNFQAPWFIQLLQITPASPHLDALAMLVNFSIDDCRFFSDVYFRMGRDPKAVELQQEILQSYHEHLGTVQPDTFRARDRLGCTKWLQGRFTEARQHQEIAVEGFKSLPDIGTNHEFKFEAMNNLGWTIGKFWETHHFEQAYELHHEAVQGLNKVLGPDHDKTLTAKESLCRVALVLRTQRKHTFNPLGLITEVVETRKVNFGKEHPLTLLATANPVIAKMEAGHLENVETMSQKRLEIRRGDHHPERLASLIQLAKAVFHQGRIEDSIKIREENIEGLEIISKAPHPLPAGMIRARDQMVPLLNSPQYKDHTKVEFPWILFPGGP
ncbi:hypothetical protein LA080_014703 [Diaporthe eres]|nr:hypothetical protein LA080_014703 [Diaporthe eres]